MLRGCEGDSNAGEVVVSAWHVCVTRSSGIVSSAVDVARDERSLWSVWYVFGSGRDRRKWE